MITRHTILCFFFFFNDTATTEIYTLSLHDALPILRRLHRSAQAHQHLRLQGRHTEQLHNSESQDRKSTRLNSSHDQISYAVFCLKKKNTNHVCCTEKPQNAKASSTTPDTEPPHDQT